MRTTARFRRNSAYHSIRSPDFTQSTVPAPGATRNRSLRFIVRRTLLPRCTQSMIVIRNQLSPLSERSSMPPGHGQGSGPGQMPGFGPSQPVEKKAPIPGIKNLVAVASGKGGVGKTTVAVNLALALKALGAKVGVLDADVYGPNVPVMLGTVEQPRALDERTIIPVEAYGIKMISMGLLNPGDKPLIWRGPMLHSVIQQFLRSVQWGELDYLIVD